MVLPPFRQAHKDPTLAEMPFTDPLAGDPGSSHCRAFFPVPSRALVPQPSKLVQITPCPASFPHLPHLGSSNSSTAIASYVRGSLVLMATLCLMSWSAANLDMSVSLHPHSLNSKAFKGKHPVLPTFSNWPVSRKLK